MVALPTVEPVELIIIQLFIIFLLAKIAAEIFEWMSQPAIIGELLVGIMLGTVYFNFLELDRSHEVLEVLSELGVIFLLFIIGLETKFSELRRVGRLALSHQPRWRDLPALDLEAGADARPPGSAGTISPRLPTELQGVGASENRSTRCLVPQPRWTSGTASQ